MTVNAVLLVAAVSGVLAFLMGMRLELTRTREGKMLAFVVLFLLPVTSLLVGFSAHMERAQSTRFCLSCHVMQDFGRSLDVDDPSYLPARHYQNNLVSREQACFTCHTNYTMFGDVNAKLRGLRHLWVQYAGTIPAPSDVKLYEPYQNRECLHCHLGARKFEEASPHHKTSELLGDMKSGHKSCTSSGCHEFIHDVGSLKDMKFWKESR